MNCFVRARSSVRRGVRFQVLYRTHPRAPIRSAGTFASASEAERVRDQVTAKIAACEPPPPPPEALSETLVYIAEIGGLLKIGISIDPAQRCRDLHAQLLHVERGGRVRERHLHAKFAHLRVDGEFFRPGERGEIRRYIRQAHWAADVVQLDRSPEPVSSEAASPSGRAEA